MTDLSISLRQGGPSRQGFRHAFTSEVTKLRSLRSTTWAMKFASGILPRLKPAIGLIDLSRVSP